MADSGVPRVVGVSTPTYPETHRGDVVETLHGTQIADPYRWLEDPDSAETVDWVRRQNAATDAHLATLDDRDWFTATLNAVVHRPRAGVPLRKAGRYVVSRNDGRQAQDVWYVADSLAELRGHDEGAGGELLIDPNTFSTDGTDSLGGLSFSDDGHYLAYTVSEGGSDWQNFRLCDLRTGTEVDDAPIQTKFSLPTWLPDGASYLYVGYPRATRAEGTQTQAVGAPRLLLHRVGTPESADEEVLAFPDDDQLIFWPELSHDDAWVLVSIVKGTENRNRLWAYPVSTTAGRSTLGPPVTVVSAPVAEFGFLRTHGDRLWLQTDLDAPRGRVVSCPIVAGDPTPELTEVVAEAESTLAAAVAVGDLLVTETLVDVTPQLDRWGLDGSHRGRVEVAGGAVVGISGEPGDPEGFVGLSSVTSPTRAYRVDVATGAVEPLDDLVAADPDGWAPPATRTVRRAAVSADGTTVPYFLITRSDLDLDAPRPTLLYGYGGFKIPVLADYRAGWSGWLTAGGVLVIANLRGGGEFGSGWYDDGRGAAKQHVFDDFVAVAEHLKETGVTTTAQLALHGRSNGGLLVGAVMTQRPDLAAVALPGVGVLDLLRFHLFTYGRAWVSDYGNPEDPDDFAVALAYSPLHNVRPGSAYPATLVTTGDHDDRVVPLHSHKFTAALQHAQAGPAPVLTRIEVATGHGAGKPAAYVASEWADLLAFAAHHTGLHPEPRNQTP